MMSFLSRYPNVFLIIGLVLLYSCAWLVNSHFMLNWDVSWDLRVTQRILKGGNYISEFVDNNPPLIFYLYMPVVLATQWLGCQAATALMGYVFVIASVSSVLCYQLGKKIFESQPLMPWVLVYALSAEFLLLPIVIFGEREHLMLIFTLPYFFAVCYRLRGGKITGLKAVGIGLFAGLGFALKPYFLAALFAVEMYFGFIQRSTTFYWRSEVITLALFFILYLLAVMTFYPSYLTTVVPFVQQFYYSGLSDTWQIVVLQPVMLFCFVAVIIGHIHRNKQPFLTVHAVLTCATIGFIIAYLSQRTAWHYHYFPMLCTASLVLILFISGLAYHPNKKLSQYGLMAFSLVGVAVFQISFFMTDYAVGQLRLSASIPLIDYLNKTVGSRSLYLLSASPNELFSAVDESHAHYDSRFQHLFWIPGVAKQTLKGQLTPTQLAIEHSFIAMVNEDIQTVQPDFIFVDDNDIKPFMQHIRFNYLTYLQSNAAFQMLWKNYHYIATIAASMPSMESIDAWRVYVEAKPGQVSLADLKGLAIILTGTGLDRTAHFVHHFTYIGDQQGPLQRPIHLTPPDIVALNGIVAGEIRDPLLRRSLVLGATHLYAYRFAVYQRNLKSAAELPSVGQ